MGDKVEPLAGRDQAGESLCRSTHTDIELPRVRDQPAGEGEEREVWRLGRTVPKEDASARDSMAAPRTGLRDHYVAKNSKSRFSHACPGADREHPALC